MFEFDLTVSISLLVSLAAMVIAWFRTRKQDVEAKFKVGSKRMDGLDRRIAKAEQEIAAMPGKDDLHEVKIALAEMAGEMKAMAASQRSTNDLLRRLETVVGRHEDHLLGPR